jgi:biotin--protein ligase
VLNALPTTSLSQLHSLLATRNPEAGVNPPTMEGTFARIMNSFEQKWEQFVEEKGFSGFMNEYYGRWLHSYVCSILCHCEDPD